MSSVAGTAEQRLNASICPRDDARLDIFRHLTKATLYRHDYNAGRLTLLDLHSYFKGKEFKIKVLNHQGVDICLEGSPFISDIKFTPMQRDLLKIIEDEERESATRQLRTINYDAEENWTLTFQLRGFKVDFDQSESKCKLKSYVTRLIYLILKKNDEDSSPYDSDYETYNRKMKSKTFKSLNLETLNQHLKDQRNMIYIEYVSDKIPPRAPIHVNERRCKGTKIMELWCKKSISSDERLVLGVLVELSGITSPGLTDFVLHSDEGAYESGINKYEGGIALIGEQHSGVMFYGNALYDGDVVIPDYFIDYNNNQPLPPTDFRNREIRLEYRPRP